MNFNIDKKNLPLNKELIGQIAKAFSEPLLVVDTELQIVYCNDNFLKIIDSDISGKNAAEFLNIKPSITMFTQNYFSDTISNIVKMNPIIIGELLRGFTITFEKTKEVSKSETNKKSFRGAAHDLNNILTNIINSIDLLRHSDGKSISHDKLMGIIENNSNRAADIIASVLSKDSKETAFKSQIDINALLEEISTSFKLFLPNRIKLSTKIQYGLPSVMGNYTDLYRSIYNLLINSKEAMIGEGKIQLNASQFLPVENDEKTLLAQKMICIKITDNGKGIDEKDLEKIFNPEYSTKDKEVVSGIGLANVRNIIEKHGGKINVKSRKDECTAFEIFLPVIEQNKSVIIDEPRRILIAEDEETLKELLKDLFESHGFQVTAVGDGTDVIKAVNDFPFYDALIIDKKMPTMDGIDCIKELNNKNNKIPIILATGSTGENLKELEAEHTLSAAIRKPYKFDELLALVNRVIL